MIDHDTYAPGRTIVHVIPTGRQGIVYARNSGPVTLYAVTGHLHWYTAADLIRTDDPDRMVGVAR